MKSTKIFVKSLAILLSILLTAFSFPMDVLADEVLGLVERLSDSSTQPTVPEKDMVELTELRTATTKHFLLEDGSYMVAQYDTVIHYPDENREWQNIDNRLSVTGSEITTSDAKIKFAKKTTGNESLFTLHDGNRKLTLSLNGASKKIRGQITNNETEFGENATKLEKMTTLDHISASVLYEDILENTDLEYVINGANIKENIIIKAPGEAYSYAFTMALNNLSVALQENGEIWITDPDTNELVYLIPAPVMWDANGEFSRSVFTTMDSQGNGKYIMTVTASSDWINDDGRAFPITIDPPIYTSTSNIVDLYCSSTSPSTSFSSATLLQAGEGRIAYWKLSTLPMLPTSAYITNATFYAKASSASSEAYIGVYDVTSGWNAAHTWNRIHAGSPQGTLASDFIDYAKISAAGDCQWTITPLVKKWYEGANYGLALTEVAEAGKNTYVSLYSNENSSNRPKLCIEYRDMKGLEDYWTYSSQSAGFAGAGSVNHATGNLVFAIPTLTSTDALMPFTPTLVYNTALANLDYTTANVYTAYTTAYTPKGFKINMQETLREKNLLGAEGISVLYYVWSDSDGTEHYFLPTTTDGVYADEDGLLLTLTEGTSICTIKDSNDNVRTFSKRTGLSGAWYLSSITDKSGNKLTFTFDSSARPTAVRLEPAGGGAGVIEQLKISYYGNVPYMIWNPVAKEAVLLQYASSYNGAFSPGATEYLIGMMRVRTTGTMTESVLRSYYDMLEYGIEEDGVIVDATASYSYDSAGRLIKVRNELSDYELHYTYTNGKVTAITEKAGSATLPTAGQSLTLTYGASNTVIRTSGTDDILNTADDLLTTYSFDGQGRTVSCYTTDTTRTQLYGASNGQYVDEEENEKAKNNLKSSVQTTQHSSNYLLNGGFDSAASDTLQYWGYGGLIGVEYDFTSDVDRAVYLRVDADESVSSIYQYLYLDEGDYTLTFDVLGIENPDLTGYASITPMSGYGGTSQKIPLNEYFASGGGTFAELTYHSDSRQLYIVKIEIAGTVTGSYAQGMTVDNVMLSKTLGSAECDILSLGHFENVSDFYAVSDVWTVVAENGENRTTSSPTLVDPGDDIFENGVLKLEDGSFADAYYAEQVLYQASDTDKQYFAEYSKPLSVTSYTISGFGKATAQSYGAGSMFGMMITIQYYNGTNTPLIENHYLPFDKSINDWQFVSGSFDTNIEQGIMYDAEGNAYTVSAGIVDTVTVKLLYSQNPGVAYFDNISLVADSKDVEVYEYTDKGKIEHTRYGRSEMWYEYDESTDLLYRAISSNKTYVVYTYDAKNRVIKETHYTYTLFYNDATDSFNGERTKKYTVSYEYDDYGLLLKTTTTDATDSTLTTVSSSTYNDFYGCHIFGTVATTTDALGNTTRYYYNTNNGRLLAVANPDMTGMTYAYDGMGNLTQVRAAEIEELTEQIDYPAEFTSTPGSEAVNYTYNTSTKLLETIVTGSSTYRFSYDVFGNTDEISVGNTTLAEYTYNAGNGKLNTLTYGNGHVVKYFYDDLDRIDQIMYNDMGTIDEDYYLAYSYTYDSAGRLSTVVDHINGETTAYRYNFAGNVDYSFVYDTATGVVKNGSKAYYDDENRISSYYQTLDYTYSGGGVIHDDNGYSYRYTDEGYLAKMTYGDDVGMTAWFDPAYDTLGRITSRDVTVGVSGVGSMVFKTSYGYSTHGGKATGQVNKVYTEIWDQDQLTFYGESLLNYTYDSKGNITRIYDDYGNTVCSYVYDDLGQLLRENNATLNRTYTWTYDNAGNVLTKKTYSYTTGSLGNPIDTQTYTYGNANWGDLLTGVDDTEIRYDAIGNPTNIIYDVLFGYRLTWEGRELTKLESTEGDSDYVMSTTTYTYNDEGIRTSKNVNGVLHEYYLDGSQIVAERVGNKLYVYVYDENGRPIAIKYRTDSYAKDIFDYYVLETNFQGDVVAIYKPDGTKIGSYAYNAYGVVTTTVHNSSYSSIVNFNPFRYRSYYYDTDTGWYYLQSRYYNPTWGRFINGDATSVLLATSYGLTDKNLFAYCDNNPITRIDDDGAFWGTITGAVLGAIGGGINAALNGNNVWAGIGFGAAAGALSGLAVDLAIATGGIAGVVIAAAGGAIASIGEDLANGAVNGDMPSTEEVITNAVFSAAGNVLSMGMSIDGTVKTGARTLKQAFSNVGENFSNGLFANSRGRVPKKIGSKLSNLGKHIAGEFGGSVVFDAMMDCFQECISLIFGG